LPSWFVSPHGALGEATNAPGRVLSSRQRSTASEAFASTPSSPLTFASAAGRSGVACQARANAGMPQQAQQPVVMSLPSLLAGLALGELFQEMLWRAWAAGTLGEPFEVWYMREIAK